MVTLSEEGHALRKKAIDVPKKLVASTQEVFTVHEAAQLAMNFTTKSIQATVDNVKSMKHGIAFELVLPELTNLSK